MVTPSLGLRALGHDVLSTLCVPGGFAGAVPATTIADASKNSRGTEGAAQGDAGAHWGHGMVR